jgi:hypothetical protein
MVNPILVLVVVLIIAIWLIIEFKRFRHKILAVFLILLIVFTYVSFSSVIKGKDLDLKTFDGMKQAGQLYFVWLGNAFKNVKVVTSNVISMDWKGNGSDANLTSKPANSKAK